MIPVPYEPCVVCATPMTYHGSGGDGGYWYCRSCQYIGRSLGSEATTAPQPRIDWSAFLDPFRSGGL